jgi:hypothetical protein
MFFKNKFGGHYKSIVTKIFQSAGICFSFFERKYSTAFTGFQQMLSEESYYLCPFLKIRGK